MKEITDAEFWFKPEYSKPAILKQDKWLNSVRKNLTFLALGVIVDADEKNSYVTFIQNKRTGKFLPVKDYRDKNGKLVQGLIFPRTAVPHEAILNYDKEYILNHFKRLKQQELKFEGKTFKRYIENVL